MARVSPSQGVDAGGNRQHHHGQPRLGSLLRSASSSAAGASRTMRPPIKSGSPKAIQWLQAATKDWTVRTTSQSPDQGLKQAEMKPSESREEGQGGEWHRRPKQRQWPAGTGYPQHRSFRSAAIESAQASRSKTRHSRSINWSISSVPTTSGGTKRSTVLPAKLISAPCSNIC